MMSNLSNWNESRRQTYIIMAEIKNNLREIIIALDD